MNTSPLSGQSGAGLEPFLALARPVAAQRVDADGRQRRASGGSSRFSVPAGPASFDALELLAHAESPRGVEVHIVPTEAGGLAEAQAARQRDGEQARRVDACRPRSGTCAPGRRRAARSCGVVGFGTLTSAAALIVTSWRRWADVNADRSVACARTMRRLDPCSVFWSTSQRCTIAGVSCSSLSPPNAGVRNHRSRDDTRAACLAATRRCWSRTIPPGRWPLSACSS